MISNRFYLLHDELVPWSLEAEEPSPWPDCHYFGDVLARVNRAHPDLGLHFILTKRVTETLPLVGDDVVVICIGDELARIPTYTHEVRLVAKTYGTRRTPNPLHGAWRSPSVLTATIAQEAFVQVRRVGNILGSSWRTLRSGSSPRVIDVPLGTYLLAESPFVPFEKRPFDVSYSGSRLTRSNHAHRRVPTQKMRSRMALEAAIGRLATERPDWRVRTHIIDTFHDAPAHRDVYSQLLMDSRIVLCPRGGSLETYRFFEALSCGSVPVTERLPDRYFYTGAPSARVRDWSELPLVLERLLSDSEQLHALHDRVLEWWAQRCSPSAVASRLVSALGA